MELTTKIMHDFQKGNLDTFYAEAYAPLLAYAARRLGEGYSLLAEDCVQDAIFASYQNRDAIQSPAQWKVYLFRLVHNRVVSVLRHEQSQQRYLEQQAMVDDDFSRSFIQQETLERLYRAIAALPEKYRQVFEMSFEEGLRNTEIAEQLGISVRAVTKQKSRMISLLQKDLGEADLHVLFMLLFIN